MLKRLILALVVTLALPPLAAQAQAYTCTGSSCVPSVSFTEPSTYTGGTPITNLQDGLFTYKLNNGANQTLIIPASSPTGGALRSNIPLAAQTVAACTTATVTGSLVARTTVGGVSAAVAAAPLLIDRTKLVTGLPDPACTTPNGPLGVTIQ